MVDAVIVSCPIYLLVCRLYADVIVFAGLIFPNPLGWALAAASGSFKC